MTFVYSKWNAPKCCIFKKPDKDACKEECMVNVVKTNSTKINVTPQHLWFAQVLFPCRFMFVQKFNLNCSSNRHKPHVSDYRHVFKSRLCCLCVFLDDEQLKTSLKNQLGRGW